MSVRDEGATHYYGDDCPGGHRAANVAGVDWDDQLTAAEANERDAATASTGATGAPKRGDVYRALASAQAARWGYVHTLDPDAYAAYIDRRAQDANLRADVDTVTALVRGQVAAELIAKAREVQAAIDDPATDPDVMSTLIDEAEGLWSAVRTVDEATWRREWEATQGGDRG